LAPVFAPLYYLILTVQLSLDSIMLCFIPSLFIYLTLALLQILYYTILIHKDATERNLSMGGQSLQYFNICDSFDQGDQILYNFWNNSDVWDPERVLCMAYYATFSVLINFKWQLSNLIPFSYVYTTYHWSHTLDIQALHSFYLLFIVHGADMPE